MRRRTWRQELRRRICAFAVVFTMLFSDTVPVLTPVSAEGQTQADTENQIQAKVLTCTKEEHLHTEDCYTDILTCGQEEAAPKYRNTFKVHRHTDDCRNAAGEIACGWQENVYYHTHNEFCRDADGKLVCGIEAKEPHTHTDECWKTDQILICENNDPGHTHSDACYESHTRLTCGQEEKDGHTHTDACYTEHRELTCGRTEEEGHAHSDACYTEHTKLTCDREEDDGHTHTDACWTEHTDLTCGLEENEEHQHSEACYTTTRELTCGQEEREGHHHGEECYTTTRELTCGKEEKKGHSHSDSCYTTTRKLTCGKQEEEGHHHTDACYTTEQNLICGQKERPAHVHSDECYEETKTLICEEPTSTHKHKAECFDEQGFCICGKVEVPVFESTAANWTEGHTHTDACYEKQLICTREEHHHTDECYEAEEPKEAEEKEELQPEAEQTAEEELATEEEPFEKEEPTDNEETTDNQELTDNEDLTDNEGLIDDKESTDDEEPTGDEKTQEEEETPDGTTVLSTKEDSPVPVTITFSAEAGIPKETELVVTDPNAAPVLRSASPKKMPGTAKMESSNKAEADEPSYADIPLTEWQAGEKAPEIQLYHRRLDISLVANGKEIEPNPDSPVTVTVTLPDLEEGLTVEVRHETENGSILLDSTTEGQYVTFTTDGFSIFDFTSTAQQLRSWTSELLENTLFGRSKDENAEHNSITIDENSIPDGFSILEAFSTTQSNNLWLMVQRIKDLVLGKLESIALYAVEDGKLAGIVKENIGITDVLRLSLGNYSSFALVRDSGLRRKIEDFGNVVLSGLMPKNGVAEATDVTEEYADFLGGQGSDKDGEVDEEQGGLGGSKQGETVDGHIEQGETVGDKQGETDGETHTIAAYDISITNDGEEYQPEDKPIEVTIKDEAIATAVANGNAISLWHVIDENTAEQITDFTVSGDTVTFNATGFSVYVVTETTVEKILTAADGKIYRITVTYDGSAQIPNGAELVVTEVDEEQYLASIATALGVDESYLLYRKFLDISFIDADGAVVEPATPVQVKIELLDVDAGADKLQVVHFGEDGAEKVTATSNENAVVTFSTGEFSVYGFGNVLEPIDTVEMDEASIELLGFGTETQLTETDSPEVEEGLEVLAFYSVDNDSQLWIKAELKEGVELTDTESVAVYSVKDSNGEDETVKTVEELAGMDTITELTTTEFAVVKDSGYRHLSFNITPDEEGTKTVTLDGMMPKAATAEAVDVTDQLAGHVYGLKETVSEESETEDQSETQEESAQEKHDQEELAQAEIKQKEASGEGQELAQNEEQDTSEQESAPKDEASQQDGESQIDDHTIQRSTIAAFDISISNNSVDYQPDADHPVAVVITDDRILPGNNLELWHIKDDGTEEKVEDFNITTGTLSFTAKGFSTYALVSTITTYYQTASGETYKIAVEYSEDAGLPADVALRITEVDADEYLADAATALGTTDSYLFYRRFFDISFVRTDEDGEHIIEPNAPVNVTIELLDVTAGAEKLQVVHFGETGAEKVTATATEDAVVSFTSSEFSVYGVGNVLTPLATAETDEANIEILGFGGEAELSAADTPVVEEGLEVLGAYNLSNETEKVWIKADVKDGVELSSMESVVIYTIGGENAANETSEEQSGEAIEERNSDAGEGQKSEAAEEQSGEAVEQAEAQPTTQIMELFEAGTVAELNVSNFALVKDTGYRHLSFEINLGGEESQAWEESAEEGQEAAEETVKIILDGMMPKMAIAEAVDVTETYADHDYVVLEEEKTDDQEQADELNTEADGEAIPEEQPLSNEAGENNTEQPVSEGEEPVAEEAQDGEEKVQDGSEEPEAEEPQDGAVEEEVPIRTTLAAFNISISNNHSEYQPDPGHPISVEIRDNRIVAGENIELWHIMDDGTEERISDFTVEDGSVKFVSLGFSVYTIVEAPEPPQGIRTVASLSELVNQLNNEPNTAFKFSINRTSTAEYFTNNYNSDIKVILLSSSISDAEDWYIEQSGDYYLVYRIDGTTRKYIKRNSNNLEFVTSTEQATVFEISEAGEGKFRFKVKNEKVWLNYSGSGGGMRFWNKENDVITKSPQNSKITLTYSSSLVIEDDPYDLDGKTYGFAYHTESVYGAGMMAEGKTYSNNPALVGVRLLVQPDVLASSGILLISQNNDLSEWTFHRQGSNTYYITTDIGGTTHYLTLNGGKLTLETEPDEQKSLIAVNAGTGSNKGKYQFSVGGYAIALSGGKAENGFVSTTSGGAYAWLNLVERSTVLTNNDFVVYSAEKVNIADRTAVPNGAQLVIFSRTWNDIEKKYEFYVINHNGDMVQCYESGDMIQWVGSEVNTALWTFTEYLNSDDTPSNFYELQNTYSGQYIAPQVTNGQILSNSTIGINMNGRRDGYYYSSIIAWDDAYYRYAGLKTENGKIVSCSMDDAEDLFYAIIRPTVTDELTTVATVDHTKYGITMKMVDFNGAIKTINKVTSTEKQDSVIGETVYNQYAGTAKLLSTDLKSDGYPTATKTGKSLSELFGSATEVNNLFLAGTYYSGGYFAFDSTQNFASFYNKDGNLDPVNFTVYKELGTNDTSPKDSLKHGQFLPYNKLSSTYATTNAYNMYTATLSELPDSDPRKGEELILVDGDTDYYFGVELSASFTQTPSGLDNWKHDIIYEFTGDDDFWLYVDGELVIDLGGIHSALSGSVNYSTGKVVVKGVETSLYAIFKSNYESRNPSATAAQVEEYLNNKFEKNEDDQYIFKDYTSHTMKIFFMERGAGASNLKMRFNLASVKPETVELTKELDGVEEKDSFMAEFPYQVWYKTHAEAPWTSLELEDQYGIRMVYKNTNRRVKYYDQYTGIDGAVYDHVFMLKPDETAEIKMPDGTIQYYVTECHVDPNVFDLVTANGDEITGTTVTGSSRKDFNTEVESVENRPTLKYVNHVDSSVLKKLTFTKKLFKEDGTTPISHDEDSSVFNFRLYLGTENDEEVGLRNKPANLQKYHVKNEYGEYCQWDETNQKFVSLGVHKTDYSALTKVEKEVATFRTSMYGSISKIPVDYTVEIRELLSGTKFMVEERAGEIPDGYSLQEYVTGEEAGTESASNTPTAKTIDDKNCYVQIKNMKGWGLRLNKYWTDDGFMEQRDDAYFAVYISNNGVVSANAEPVTGTVRRLKQGESTLYWHFKHLEVGKAFNDYVVREVVLTATGTLSIAEDGSVTGYDSITPVKPGNKITLGGSQTGVADHTFDYLVSYDQGELTDDSNIRIDTITNSRPGIRLIKKDMEGTPLPGAVFTLSDGNGDPAGKESYTSDANGLIGIVYLRQNETYTLTEVSAPAGYQAASYHATVQPIQLVLSGTNITASGGDYTNYYNLEVNQDQSEAIGTLTVRNKKFTLTIHKVDENNNVISGVHFALYKEVKGAKGYRRDYLALDGFKDLVTDENGVVPEITNALQNGTLQPGVYYLSEKEPPDGCTPLSNDVLFTVTPAGAVKLGSANQDGQPNQDGTPDLTEYANPSGTNLVLTDSNTANQVAYDLYVVNQQAEEVGVTVEKTVVNGTTADNNATNQFAYTATLYLPDHLNLWKYGNGEFKTGKTTFSIGHGQSKVLTVPVGGILEITERGSNNYTTASNWTVTTEQTTTSSEIKYNAVNLTNTINLNDSTDLTVKYTNTRKRVNVTVNKTLSDPFLSTDTFNYTGILTDNGVTEANDSSYTQLLNSFSINVSNNKGSKKITLPVGAVLTVNEEENAAYTTTSNRTGNSITVANNASITFTNTRKTQTVTVTKTLNDSTATEAIPFTFDVTLTGINDAAVSGYKIITDPETTTDASGKATFTLLPGIDGTAVSKALMVPYGAKLVVSEQPYSGNDKTFVTTVDGVEGDSKEITVTSDQTIAFVNTLSSGTVSLGISKTVPENPDDTAYPFELAWTGLTDGEEYSYTRYSKNGSEWVAQTGTGATGTLTASSGKLSFRLAHAERIVISDIPSGTQVTVQETNSNGLIPSYSIVNGATESSDTATIVMSTSKEIVFTNSPQYVAPTGFSTRHTPFLLLLLFGLMLLIGGMGFIRTKRRNDDGPGIGGASAINTTPSNTGPPGNYSPPPPAIHRIEPAPQPTYSTTDPVSHVRWRNSVWVEESHTSQRGYVPSEVRCPQARLWMNGGGDAG